MADVANVKLGNATVTFNAVAIGHTKGGVEVSYEPDIYEKTVDKYGSTPVGGSLIGERLTVKCMFAEHTLDQFKVALAGATFVDGATSDQIDLGKIAGATLTPSTLKIHPDHMGASVAEDWDIYKAIVIGAVTVPYKVEDEIVYEVTFLALVDESKVDGKKLAKIGTSA